jgi:hypothetical protein
VIFHTKYPKIFAPPSARRNFSKCTPYLEILDPPYFPYLFTIRLTLTSILSISYLYSTCFSSIFSKSFHYSTYLSPIFSTSFHISTCLFTRNTPKFSRLPPLGAIFLSAPPILKSWIRPWSLPVRAASGSIFSKSFHYSTYLSPIFSTSFHISTCLSSILFIPYHYFLPYFPYHFHNFLQIVIRYGQYGRKAS